jgi:hypothetical protein
MRVNAIAAVLLGLAALFSVAGCGSDSSGSSTGGSQHTVGAPGAGVSFTTPKKGAKVGSTITAKVKLTDFTLAPSQVGKAAKQGQGHLHFSLDNGKYDFPRYSGANGKTAVKLGAQGTYSPSTAPTITYSNIPPGKHTLLVYLANNDHSDTGVATSTTFTVKGGGGAKSAPKPSKSNGSGSGY